MESRDFDLKVYNYLSSFIVSTNPQYIIESPIEKYLFIQIIRLAIAENNKLIVSPFNGIFPQAKVTINDDLFYMVDFVFHTHAKHKIAVELDGKDFHEKTKDQAQADKEKDRNLQQAGYFVARFTGAEVYAGPKEILFKIMDIANDLDKEKRDGS